MDNNRFTELLNLYLLDSITDREGTELAGLLAQPAYQSEFERRVNEQMQKKELDLETPPQSVHDRIQTWLDQEIGLGFVKAGRIAKESRPAPVHRVHFLRQPFWRYAAVFLLVVAGGYLYQNVRTPELPPQAQRFKNDLQPGRHRATLVLAEGNKVPLIDSVGMWKKTGGRGDVSITTKKGETYSLVLPDGTKVWLNASSTLRCPIAFAPGQRRVELTGEAYFEVTHDAKNPFSVKLPDGSLVKDLGTRFNVHAYGDEKAIRTTLLEGSVKLEAKGQSLALIPGEQAEYSAQETSIRRERVNLKNAVAWKEEQFVLESTSIQEIMRQVERWYGATIVYQDNMESDKTEFFGTLTRNVPVSQLLKTLEATGHVHFIIEGDSITVMK